MTPKQEAAIRQHGFNLLAIFPDAAEKDPVKLCKKLRRLEAEGHAFGERLCNGPEFKSQEAEDAAADSIIQRVLAILKPAGEPTRPWLKLNRDPRGYALKIDADDSRDLVIYKDWGGYGIIAPEIGKDGF